MSQTRCYKVIWARDIDELERKVNGCLEAGFEPHGSMVVCSEQQELYQPMICTPDTGEGK